MNNFYSSKYKLNHSRAQLWHTTPECTERKMGEIERKDGEMGWGEIERNTELSCYCSKCPTVTGMSNNITNYSLCKDCLAHDDEFMGVDYPEGNRMPIYTGTVNVLFRNNEYFYLEKFTRIIYTIMTATLVTSEMELFMELYLEDELHICVRADKYFYWVVQTKLTQLHWFYMLHHYGRISGYDWLRFFGEAVRQNDKVIMRDLVMYYPQYITIYPMVDREMMDIVYGDVDELNCVHIRKFFQGDNDSLLPLLDYFIDNGYDFMPFMLRECERGKYIEEIEYQNKKTYLYIISRAKYVEGQVAIECLTAYSSSLREGGERIPVMDRYVMLYETPELASEFTDITHTLLTGPTVDGIKLDRFDRAVVAEVLGLLGKIGPISESTPLKGYV